MKNITTRRELREFRYDYGLRRNWHEPDEQDIDACPAVGSNFDNANADPKSFDVEYARREDEGGIYDTVFKVIPNNGYSEHGVFLFHEGCPVAFINLAILLALATGEVDEPLLG